MARKQRSLHGLGKLQAEVMEIIWDKAEATVSDVHQVISRRRPVTYTTVLVAMQKLDKKGWLTHRREGRANVYTPRRSREQANAGLLRELVAVAFQSDPKLLLSHLLDQHPLSQAELTELRQLIEARRREKSRE
ncbi:MAG TPA: BlaI/MecI/CopY family transcriptional regulator [Planctomycetaceae bacterium]|nr:BlaI/MecI/CopY family transcriptional regulator [Planctomycetaceae bacterium]